MSTSLWPDRLLQLSERSCTIEVMNRKMRDLQRRIESIKEKLASVGELRPGSLSEQYNVCGKPACRCKAVPPQRHGPYYQLGWTRKRKSTTRFVRQSELATVRQQLKNYALLQSLVEQWIDLSIELCDLKRSEAKKK
jgi:hypothetical protein